MSTFPLVQVILAISIVVLIIRGGVRFWRDRASNVSRGRRLARLAESVGWVVVTVCALLPRLPATWRWALVVAGATGLAVGWISDLRTREPVDRSAHTPVVL